MGSTVRALYKSVPTIHCIIVIFCFDTNGVVSGSLAYCMTTLLEDPAPIRRLGYLSNWEFLLLYIPISSSHRATLSDIQSVGMVTCVMSCGATCFIQPHPTRTLGRGGGRACQCADVKIQLNDAASSRPTGGVFSLTFMYVHGVV
jgi:hypothetical protein